MPLPRPGTSGHGLTLVSVSVGATPQAQSQSPSAELPTPQSPHGSEDDNVDTSQPFDQSSSQLAVSGGQSVIDPLIVTEISAFSAESPVQKKLTVT